MLGYLSITDIVFTTRLFIFLPPITAAYAYVNYLETISIGEPIYWFLAWEDYTTLLVLVGINLMVYLMLCLIEKLSHVIKRSHTKLKSN